MSATSDSSSEAGRWQQRRQYPDHLGYPVVLEEFVEPGREPEPREQVAFQVYSTVPLDADHSDLLDYLMGSWGDSEPLPLFEFYSYCPQDTFDCIAHNRREINYRKQQHIILSTPNPAPLIPMFFSSFVATPIGCCILLNSQSYRLGHTTDVEAYEEVGQAPDWLYFNRTFSWAITEVSESNRTTRPSPVWPHREVFPEGFEMEIRRMRTQDIIGQHIVEIFTPITGHIQYGLEVGEGPAPHSDPPSEARIQQRLDRQFTDGNFALDPTFRLSHGEDSTVAVTNTVNGAEPDLQYLLYVPFLSHLRGGAAAALLESTGRLFTAALVAHLPRTKTLNLELHIPDSNSWSSILPAHRAALRRHGNSFPIGALHTFSTDENDPNKQPALHRVSPQRRSDHRRIAWQMLQAPYRVFAVVLEKPTFVRHAGVCFYMTDRDETNDPFPSHMFADCTKVWRSAGMPQVARRLAMLVVEEDEAEE